MKANKKTFDITIVGAGPAGCAAALALGRSGLKVALIDKDIFPREKSCGDAIPGPAIKALTNAFPFMHEAFYKLKKKHKIEKSRIVAANGRSINYHWQLPAYNIKREVFDAFLLDLVKRHTPIKIITGFELKEIKQGNPFTLISKDDSINTKFIIGCDGAGSATARYLGHEVMVKPEKVMAVRAYYKGINLSSDTNHFYVLKKYLPGYFWIFPLGEDMFNVGFGMKTDKQGKVSIKMKEVMEEITAHPGLANIFHGAEQLSDVKGALIPIGGKKGSYSGDGFLMAGDAAFLADPLQGHGIDKAVVSGMLAGLHAQSCFREDDFSSEKNFEYDLTIRNGIEKELRKNWMRQKILRRFPNILNIYSFTRK